MSGLKMSDIFNSIIVINVIYWCKLVCLAVSKHQKVILWKAKKGKPKKNEKKISKGKHNNFITPYIPDCFISSLTAI